MSASSALPLPIELSEWLIACAILLLGTVIQGSIGFGLALFGAPLLYWLNQDLVPGPMLVVGMSLPLLIVIREWRAMDVQGVKWTIPGQLSGAVLAGLVLAVVDESLLSLLFGVLVLLAVILSALAGAPRITPGRLLSAGTLSGFMATATSIGGPPLAIAYQSVSGARLRASLSAVFVVGAFGSLSALAVIGRFGLEEMLIGLSLLPPILIGFWVSIYTATIFDRQWLRAAVLGVSAVAGLAAIGQGVWG
ncbi:hypothetical protein HH1059_20880 [Halorhodospira halochloris]|uniref:Probable membrane transporter protein n=1 Tax=Halorhodospira halochloris TaxID=1052 RepID=A0A110B687_HALHR|nr:sulfite exporter TauE/SafE family protein [Halorhodospira halochloris]MCG5548217.1 sulfite exporter TauE/SafE family protein [Halorhodospira halochloris]BAU58797.1 hypothetical protein HH1059_20880 [Halorhodospira halochloris]